MYINKLKHLYICIFALGSLHVWCVYACFEISLSDGSKMVGVYVVGILYCGVFFVDFLFGHYKTHDALDLVVKLSSTIFNSVICIVYMNIIKSFW